MSEIASGSYVWCAGALWRALERSRNESIGAVVRSIRVETEPYPWFRDEIIADEVDGVDELLERYLAGAAEGGEGMDEPHGFDAPETLLVEDCMPVPGHLADIVAACVWAHRRGHSVDHLLPSSPEEYPDCEPADDDAGEQLLLL